MRQTSVKEGGKGGGGGGEGTWNIEQGILRERLKETGQIEEDMDPTDPGILGTPGIGITVWGSTQRDRLSLFDL